MDKENNDKLLEEQIVQNIKSGQVKMRPRWHFLLKTALMATGLIIILFTILYLASFIIFASHRSGIWFMPALGLRGWLDFFIYLPWLLILLIIIFIIILEFLAKHYSFSYLYPLSYSVLAIILVVIFGGYLLSCTPLHNRLLQYAKADRLPLAGGFYRQYEQCCSEIHRGEVINTNLPIELIIKKWPEELLNVLINSETRLPTGASFVIGDMVIVSGPEIEHVIKARGIIKIKQ